MLETDDLDRLVPWARPEPRPLGLVAAWLYLELAENLSEINQLTMLRSAVASHGAPDVTSGRGSA